jgi:hypothetical protein
MAVPVILYEYCLTLPFVLSLYEPQWPKGTFFGG